MDRVLFPSWQVDRREYDAVCAYLGLAPSGSLYERLSRHLSEVSFRLTRPSGFSLYLASLKRTRFRIARLDLATRLIDPDNPIRHVLNGVIALHECDGVGYRQMAEAPTGPTTWFAIIGRVVALFINAVVTTPWMAWHAARYVFGIPFGPSDDLTGKRVLITGVSRGLGADLMLHCLENGAAVIGTVRTRESADQLRAALPVRAPVDLVVADLSIPGAMADALQRASITPEALDMAVLCAGVKHDGASVVSLVDLRETFQVNLFAAVEFAEWFFRRPAAHPQSLVVVSSMGRWHGMHSSGGYNASKAALSIWAESLDMELHDTGRPKTTITVVEPGMFESGMTDKTAVSKLLFVSRRQVARRIIRAGLTGRQAIRPPSWFAWLTWGVCLAGRSVRRRIFARVKSTGRS